MASYSLTQIIPDDLSIPKTNTSDTNITHTSTNNLDSPVGIQFITFADLMARKTAIQKSAVSNIAHALSSTSGISDGSIPVNTAEPAAAAPNLSKKMPILGLKALLKRMEEDQSGRFKVRRNEDGSVKVTKFAVEKTEEGEKEEKEETEKKEAKEENEEKEEEF